MTLRPPSVEILNKEASRERVVKLPTIGFLSSDRAGRAVAEHSCSGREGNMVTKMFPVEPQGSEETERTTVSNPELDGNASQARCHDTEAGQMNEVLSTINMEVPKDLIKKGIRSKKPSSHKNSQGRSLHG